MPELLGGLLAVAILLAVPAGVVWAIVHSVRHPDRERGGGSVGLGAALQELDRLVARPSVEHVEEAQHKIVDEKPDPGGE